MTIPLKMDSATVLRASYQTMERLARGNCGSNHLEPIKFLHKGDWTDLMDIGYVACSQRYKSQNEESKKGCAVSQIRQTIFEGGINQDSLNRLLPSSNLDSCGRSPTIRRLADAMKINTLSKYHCSSIKEPFS